MCAKTAERGPIRLRVTHQQISEQVGVSRAVVTKALHGTGGARMNAETRAAILRVAREMGYRPRNVTTHNIAYVVPVQALELQGEVSFLRHVTQALRRHGYRLTLINFEEDDTRGLYEMLNPKVVDGAIFMRWPRLGRKALESLEIPYIVTADDDQVEEDIDQVTMDTAETLRRLTRHLLFYKHRKLLLLTGPGGISHNEHIKEGVLCELASAGLEKSACTIIESRTDSGVKEPLRVALQQGERATAIIADSPEKGAIALNYLNRWGYNVPGDISLAVVLDNRHLSMLQPALTATTALGESVAACAVSRLVDRIENPEIEPQKIYVPGEVIERQSVSTPPEL